MPSYSVTLSSPHWALLLELIRHIGPFLALSLNEYKVLETIYSQTIRRQVLVLDLAHFDVPIPEIRPFLRTIVNRLSRLGLLLGLDSGRPVVNIYGMVRFYQELAVHRRERGSKARKVEQLRKAVETRFQHDQIGLAELAMPVPVLDPRPNSRLGRTDPVLESVLGRKRTVFKWRLIDAAMGVAIRYLNTKALFFTFMRCINMTLERDAIDGLFSIDRLLYGHYDRGSVGLPLGERAARASLHRLEELGLLAITRKRPNHKTGCLSLNILGIAAIHARDHRSARSVELYYSTYELLDRLNREDDFQEIFGTPISAYVKEAAHTCGELHEEVHKALNSYHGRTTLNGRWSDGFCPLAAVNHEHGTDANPSFGIFIDADGTILYNCFACGNGRAQPISHLFSTMARELGEFPAEACRTCLSVSRLMKLKAVRVPSESHESEALSDNVIDRYPLLSRYTRNATGYLKKYLRGRGATDDAYEHFRVRYLPGGRSDGVPKTLVTAFTDRDGSVSALRVKSLAAKDLKHSRGVTTVGSLGSSLFGLAQADTSQPLLVVEGEIDALCAYSFGFTNVVATGGVARSTEALAAVLRLWSQPTVYLGLDCDRAGQDAQDRLIDLLGSEMRGLYRVVWSDCKLAGPHARYGKRQTCKDPGDIRDRADFWEVVRNAELVGRPRPRIRSAG